MKQSRQKSSLIQTEKSKYPKCAKVKTHSKQQLNYICLSNNCTSKGLICNLCKNSNLHQGHHIQPLTTFLQNLDNLLKDNQLNKGMIIQWSSQLNGSSEHLRLDELQQAHLQSLSILKIQIEAISYKIRLCQQEIMKEYESSRQKILLQYQKQKLLNKTLFQIQSYLSPQSIQLQNPIFDLKLNISKLLTFLKINKNDIQVTNESQTIVNNYIFKNNCLKQNLLTWQKQTNNILNQIFKLKLEYHLNKDNKDKDMIRPNTAKQMSQIHHQKNVAMAFSNLFKTQSIVLSNADKLARVKDDKYGKVVLLNVKALDVKKFPVKFKILTMSNAGSIQIGLCLKSIVHQKAYKFDKSIPEHGYYVISSNGFIYSSNDPTINSTKVNLLMKVGDQIHVQLQKKEKCVIKRKNDNKSIQIVMKHLNQNDWKDVYVCVSLHSKEDKIELIS